jgi:vacuole morphology and inheritance protein 14
MSSTACSSTVGSVATSRSKLVRDEIKWQDLLAHFRSVQAKHEKARRIGLGGNPGPLLDGYSGSGNATGGNRPSARRRVTGDAQLPNSAILPMPSQVGSRGTGALSPLNPRARVGTGNPLIGALSGSQSPRATSPSPMLAQQRGKRGLSITRK